MNVYQMVTDRILQQMEKGVIPWQRPWEGGIGFAWNRVTKKPYSVLNQMMLGIPGEWASYNQWKKLGGQVRKGEKSSAIVFWDIRLKQKEGEDGEKEQAMQVIPILKWHTVFHVSQVDGVEPEPQSEPDYQHSPAEEAEDIIKAYTGREKALRVQIELSGQAFYSPQTDTVVLPKITQFPMVEEYYSTAFHELTHSTGHSSRLDRKGGMKSRFGSEEYSREELIAELGAAMLVNMAGLETEKSFRNSVGYLQNWMNVLREDNRMIVLAASQAERAVKYITTGEK